MDDFGVPPFMENHHIPVSFSITKPTKLGTSGTTLPGVSGGGSCPGDRRCFQRWGDHIFMKNLG